MKLAVIGSRNFPTIRLADYIPSHVTEIVSGGARGIDREAKAFAAENHIPLREFLPDYRKYGRGAPLKRNEEIAAYADEALAFWDGQSRGTAHTVSLFKSLGKKVTVIILPATNQKGQR